MIIKPYTLFTRIPIVKNDAGRFFCEPLWAKDLALHLKYIVRFSLCCPVRYSNDTQDLVDITDLRIDRIFELKIDYGIRSVLKNLLPNLRTVLKACRYTNIVHSGGAGWAFPLSFYILLLKPFISFQWIMLIESSFWMLDKHEKPTLRKIIEHHLYRTVLSICVNIADARIFTQSFYKNYFLGNNNRRSMINCATWVDGEMLLSPDIVKKRFSSRAGKIVKIIFPTRLIPEKGVYVVFKAIEILKKMDIAMSLTIMGSGELEAECREFALHDFGDLEVVFREPVEYGRNFFDVIGEYDFVLVPNLKQEQPRIIFDAFSQGVPIIASNTSGILDITDESNSIIFKAGDPRDLAKALYSIAKQEQIPVYRGLSGLKYAAGKTHLQMHLDRQEFLEALL